MAVVIDSITPSPVILPRNSSVPVLVTAHQTFTPDDPGRVEFVLTVAGQPPVVLASVDVLVDSPNDPPPAIPWPDIAGVPLDLAGVTVTNNGGGSYTFTHAG